MISITTQRCTKDELYYLFNNTAFIVQRQSTVMFVHNRTLQHGGAIYVETHVTFLLEENSLMTLPAKTTELVAISGGAIHIPDNSTAIITGFFSMT